VNYRIQEQLRRRNMYCLVLNFKLLWTTKYPVVISANAPKGTATFLKKGAKIW